MGDDLAHLLPAIRPLAAAPAAERLARLRDRHWIRHPRADAIVTRLDALFEHGPGLMRPPNLLVVGPTNNGKSMLAERFRRAHPTTSSDDGEHEAVPVLVVQMPSGPAIRRFHGAVLAALGSPIPAHGPVEASERRVLDMLRTVGVRVLVIDELHSMLAGSHRQQREFLNLLRFLGNELRIPLVALGTREAHIALRSDDQLENRDLGPSLCRSGRTARTSPGCCRASRRCCRCASPPAWATIRPCATASSTRAAA